MQKRDFETYQKRFRDFEILQKFSETHVFRGTIRHPYLLKFKKRWNSSIINRLQISFLYCYRYWQENSLEDSDVNTEIDPGDKISRNDI